MGHITGRMEYYLFSYSFLDGISQVAMATAAKAKLLLRELKTVKADLTFTKQRCTQLEEENRTLRHNGPAHHDDDMVL